MTTKYKHNKTFTSVDVNVTFVSLILSVIAFIFVAKQLSDTTRKMNMYHKYYVVVDSLVNSDKDLKHDIEQYGEYLDIAEKTKNSIGYE